MKRKQIVFVIVTAVLALATGGWLLQRSATPSGSVYQSARLFDDVPLVRCPLGSQQEVVRQELTSLDGVLLRSEHLERLVGREPLTERLDRGLRTVGLHDVARQ